MPNPASSVQPVHFEDFEGAQFERLVFAYHARAERWKSLEWYGQAGSDLGRDIWGSHDDGESVCIQCVNRTGLTFAKIRDDLSKVLRAPNGIPGRFRIVARSSVSAVMRDKIKAHVESSGVKHCDIWSGKELEEFLRHRAESLLKRFVGGELFPDTEPELTLFAQADGLPNDNDILAMMAKLFDRPAFYTPIHQESKHPIKLYGSQRISWVERATIDRNAAWIDEWKVLMTRVQGTSAAVETMFLSRPIIAGPGEACTESYVVAGRFANEKTARSYAQYLRTRFVRFLVSLRKPTQDAAKDIYAFVPDIPLNRTWTDQKLYERYGLTPAEIAFIESTVKPMDDSHE